MDKITVAIVDKQALFRIGVRQALSQQPDFDSFDCAPKENPMVLIEANSPDVLLLDIDYPCLKGLDLARKIALHCPTTKVIMLTSNPDDGQLFEIIKVGAVAFLDKSIDAKELIETIRRVYHGEYPLNESVLTRPGVAEHVLRQFQNMNSNNEKNVEAIVAPLTSRETQILQYVANGKANKQIASILQISEQTIKNHVSNILRKLNANDRAHAVFLAMCHGWITTEELQKSGIFINNN